MKKPSTRIHEIAEEIRAEIESGYFERKDLYIKAIIQYLDEQAEKTDI